MTPSEIKYQYEQKHPQGRFFSRENMRFSGDTMRNFGVSDAGDYWELYRKHRTKHGFISSFFFHKETFKQISSMTFVLLETAKSYSPIRTTTQKENQS